MQYHIIMVKSEEGFAVSCPALPGCHSQGATHDEALANIREAIQLWLEVAEEDAGREAETEGALLPANWSPFELCQKFRALASVTPSAFLKSWATTSPGKADTS
jgi:predicted RNase H-like HicB family nuclease